MPDLTQQLNSINKMGFTIGKNNLTIAFLSLRLALKAWFSTYKCIFWKICWVEPDLEFAQTVGVEGIKTLQKQMANPLYIEAYSECIVHFHHFIELILKDILRREHILLTVDASTKPVLYHKLLRNEAISSEEYETLYSIEFSDALFRIIELLKDNRLDKSKYGFISQNKPILDKLNNLRNRLLHRGTFILPYRELDLIIGTYFLPLVLEVIKLPMYKKFQRYWKYEPLDSGIDPIALISDAFESKKYDPYKIAFLKELGRAAYVNPIERRGLILGVQERERAERAAIFEREENTNQISDIKKCPVCGSMSLIIYSEIESEFPDPENPGMVWMQTTFVQCFCCTFSVNYLLKNASEYGLPLDDYWYKIE